MYLNLYIHDNSVLLQIQFMFLQFATCFNLTGYHRVKNYKIYKRRVTVHLFSWTDRFLAENFLLLAMRFSVEAQDETRAYNEIYKITKTEIGSPCNENGEYKNCQKNNRMDAI